MLPSYDHMAKVIIIGEENVGKSLLLLAMTENQNRIDQYKKTYSATIGVEFGTKIFEMLHSKKKVKLQCWDTAGREVFRSITRSYYRGSHHVILVVDPSKPKSINSIPSLLQSVSDLAPDANVFVVCNEHDGNREQIVPDAYDNINAKIAESDLPHKIHQFGGTKSNPILYTRLDVANIENVQVLVQPVVIKSIPESADSEELEPNSFLDCVTYGIDQYLKSKGNHVDKDHKIALLYAELLSNDNPELVDLVATLALFTHEDGKRLKQTVFNSISKNFLDYYPTEKSVLDALKQEISRRSGLHEAVLNNLVSNIVDAANANDEKTFKKAFRVTMRMTAHVTESVDSTIRIIGKMTTDATEQVNSNLQQHKKKMITFLQQFDISNLQKHAKHKGLPIIKKLANSANLNNPQQLDTTWEEIKTTCAGLTTGWKNAFAKSTFFADSRGRHPLTDIIYRAVVNPDSVYTRVVDHWAVVEATRGNIDLKISAITKVPLPSEQKRAALNFYDNVLYAAAKYPDEATFKTVISQLDLKALTDLQTERDMIKKLEDEIIKHSSDIMESQIKILTYSNLIRQIKTSGFAGLDFDKTLPKVKWKGDERIRQEGKEIIPNNNYVILKDALCWVRGTGFGTTTSETIYHQLVKMKALAEGALVSNPNDTFVSRKAF